MEKKYSELIQRLYKLTKERKLEWRKTSSENEYMLELNAALLCKNNKNKNEKSWRFVVDISALLCYNKVYKGADLLL